MKSVRVTRTPPGLAQQIVPGVPDIRQTISAAPRGTGTINAEGGETIVGDLNRDGLLEHQRIVGPSHRGGGVDLDVEPGTFVFSNAKELRTKHQGTLDRFTTGKSKQGATPADMAKQYDINTPVNTLKDELASPLAKRTAQLMLKTNSQKLAELALYQESLKGFPNGIPAIAQQLVPQELQDQVAPPPPGEAQEAQPDWDPQGEQGEQPPMIPGQPGMRRGGQLDRFLMGGERPQFQVGGQPGQVPSIDSARIASTFRNDSLRTMTSVPGVDSTRLGTYNKNEPAANTSQSAATTLAGAPLPQAKQKLYLNDKAISVTSVDPSLLSTNPNAAYIKLSNGESVTKAEWKQIHSDKPLLRKPTYTESGFGYAPQSYSNRPQAIIRKFAGDITLSKGDSLKMDGNDYEVLDPHGEHNEAYHNTGKMWRDVFDNTNGIVMVRNKATKEIEFKEGEDITQSKKNAPEYFGVTGIADRNAARDAKLRLRKQHDAEQAQWEARQEQEALQAAGQGYAPAADSTAAQPPAPAPAAMPAMPQLPAAAEQFRAPAPAQPQHAAPAPVRHAAPAYHPAAKSTAHHAPAADMDDAAATYWNSLQ